MPDHVQTILTYYQGCNTCDFELLCSTLAADTVHYFVDHAPVRGRTGLANYWVKVAPRTDANWQLDHAIVQDDEAVIEWSMRWLPPGATDHEILRGTEWYRFDPSGQITEIRSYHNNIHLQDARNRELWGFDYEARGYRTE